MSNVDLTQAEGRWPRFATAAADAGFAVSHAVPMRLRRQVIGALNLFARSREPLTDEHLAVVQGLADVATIGLLHERAVRDQVVLAEQLQTALDSRVLLEQAKGVLSARTGLDVSGAFQLLRTYARRTGQSLTTVAQAVLAGSLLPDELRRVADRR